MKKALIIAMATAIGLAAQAPAGTGTRSPKTSKTAVAAKKATSSSPSATTIPKDAIAAPDGSYSWTDKQGQKWSFLKTPFGIMKYAQSTPAVSTPAPTPMAGVKAIDAGDKVRFETTTPFGISKREKNKADLTDEERSLYNSQNPGKTAKQD